MNIKPGDKSPEVKSYQEKLSLLGYGLNPDGDFGTNTLLATNNFQKLNGLPLTQEVDESLLKAITDDIDYNSKIDQPSIKRIMTMHPKVRFEVLHLFKKCFKQGLRIRIVQAYRTFAEQNELYAQGRTKPGPIVTNAKGGLSNHNYGLACYDDITEILTNNGFKLFKDLSNDDMVATFKDNMCEFQYPLAYISYFYEGEMIQIKSRSVDQLITPNHKMIVKKKTNQKWDENWSFIEAENINHQYKIPTNGIIWNNLDKNNKDSEEFDIDQKSSHLKHSTTLNLSQNKTVLKYPFNNLMTDECWWEFMGWYLSEGLS